MHGILLPTSLNSAASTTTRNTGVKGPALGNHDSAAQILLLKHPLISALVTAKALILIFAVAILKVNPLPRKDNHNITW